MTSLYKKYSKDVSAILIFGFGNWIWHGSHFSVRAPARGWMVATQRAVTVLGINSCAQLLDARPASLFQPAFAGQNKNTQPQG